MHERELHERADRYIEQHREGRAPPLYDAVSDAGVDAERLADLIELRLSLSGRPLLDHAADLGAVASVMSEEDRPPSARNDEPRAADDNVIEMGRFHSARQLAAAAASKARELAAATRGPDVRAASKRRSERYADGERLTTAAGRLMRKVKDTLGPKA